MLLIHLAQEGPGDVVVVVVVGATLDRTFHILLLTRFLHSLAAKKEQQQQARPRTN